jgi:hypothetical protein
LICEGRDDEIKNIPPKLSIAKTNPQSSKNNKAHKEEKRAPVSIKEKYNLRISSELFAPPLPSRTISFKRLSRNTWSVPAEHW